MAKKKRRKPNRRNTGRPTVAQSSAQAMESLSAMLHDYNRVMAELGMAMTRRQLRGMNVIDTRELIRPSDGTGWGMPKPDVGIGDKMFLVANYWYGFIPCFEEGILHVNADRYVHWKIRELAMDQNRIDVFLRDYSAARGEWQPGVCGVVTWRFDDPGTAGRLLSAGLDRLRDPNGQDAGDGRRLRMEYAVVDCRGDYPRPLDNYGDLYSDDEILRRMDWSPAQKRLWKDVIVRNGYEKADAFMKTSGHTALEELAKLFTDYVLRVNCVLEGNKISKSRRAEPERPMEPVRAEDPAPDEPGTAPAAKKEKTRRIRTIGLLQITSDTVPRASNRKTVTHYSVASWTRCGHIRTYRSGKRTFIRETTVHRKALSGQSGPTDVLPTTIRFVDNTGKIIKREET